MLPSSRQQRSDAGVAGLCSAGRAIALRLAARGLRVSLWDESAADVEEFIAANAGSRGGMVGYADREDFVESLREPRRIVVFRMLPEQADAALPALLHGADRVVEYPWQEQDASPEELEQIELTLLCALP